MKFFNKGFIAILPLASGIIPFGAVVGSSFAEAGLSFVDAMFMNITLYSGTAQLATTELMKLGTAVVIVVLTGLIINLRFLLYSAAMASYLVTAPAWIKFICAFTLTDQSYAAMTANTESFKSNQDAIHFYLGTAAAMMMIWHFSVVIGFMFGNIAPRALNLDFAVPLSFIALLIPTLKTNTHRLIALTSSILSIAFYSLPFRSGLMVTAILSIAMAWFIIKRKFK